MVSSETPESEPVKIPLGVPSLDSRLKGGVRPGTTILASGKPGTGYRAFLWTAAVLHGNWQAGTDLFELAYDEIPGSVRQPAQVRFISVVDSETVVKQHLRDTADDDAAAAAIGALSFRSLSEELAELGVLKPSQNGGFEYTTVADRSIEAYDRMFNRFDDLIEAVPGEVIILESLSDFLPVVEPFADTADLFFIAQTLCHVIAESDSILIAGANTEALSKTEEGHLKRPFEGVFDFDWFGEGPRRRPTMSVAKFPEFRREAGTDGRSFFDLTINRDRFGISRTEKIPPSQL